MSWGRYPKNLTASWSTWDTWHVAKCWVVNLGDDNVSSGSTGNPRTNETRFSATTNAPHTHIALNLIRNFGLLQCPDKQFYYTREWVDGPGKWSIWVYLGKRIVCVGLRCWGKCRWGVPWEASPESCRRSCSGGMGRTRPRLGICMTEVGSCVRWMLGCFFADRRWGLSCARVTLQWKV